MPSYNDEPNNNWSPTIRSGQTGEEVATGQGAPTGQGALTAEEKKYLHPDTCTCWNCVAARKRSGGK